MTEEDLKDLRHFFYDLFILDTLIGNTDRHPGNIGIILDDLSTFKRIAPVYDCGSSLSLEVDDSELDTINVNQTALSVDSVLCENSSNGKKNKIRYADYFMQSHTNIDSALVCMIPKINIVQIEEIIRATPFLSEKRKQFYIDSIKIRYNKIFIKALLRIFPLQKAHIEDSSQLYDLYKQYIKPIHGFPLYRKQDFDINGRKLCTMRISNKYAIMLKNDECSGIFPISSNNDEIRRAIYFLQQSGIYLLNEESNKSKASVKNSNIFKQL